ncbi:hypothetical protein C8R46DRAFT_1216594 [Mycena filopes]|nr:hypothetical protein C8R46DRAFT_1216594 [Mycena filopes]
MELHPRLPPFVTRETLGLAETNPKPRPMEKAKVNNLLRQLQTRLQYARLKVDHGWQKQRLNEVENLYFRAQRQPVADAGKPPLAGTVPEYTPHLLSTPLDPQLLAEDAAALSFKQLPGGSESNFAPLSAPESLALAQYTHAYTNSPSGSGSGWLASPQPPNATTTTTAVDPLLSQWIQLPPPPPPPSAPSHSQTQTTSTSYDAFWSSHAAAAQIQIQPAFMSTPTFASASGNGNGNAKGKGKGRVHGGAVAKRKSPVAAAAQRRSPVRVVGAGAA